MITPLYPTEPTPQPVPEYLPSAPSVRDGSDRIRRIQQDLDDSFDILSKSAPALDDLLPRVIPDGIMNAETKRAIALFQLIRGLEPTGEPDDATEAALSAAGQRARELNAPALGVKAFGEDNLGGRLTAGERTTATVVLQVMLDALSRRYDFTPPPVTGVYDGVTEEAVRNFQSLNGLAVTGEVDKITWNRLTAQANVLFTQLPKE